MELSAEADEEPLKDGDSAEKKGKGIEKKEKTSNARYLTLILCIACFTSLRSNDLTFSFTVICMSANDTDVRSRVYFTPTETSLIFSSSGLGAVPMSLVAAILLQRIGCRRLMSGMLLLSSLATAFFPLFAKNFDPVYVVPLRFIQGTGFACVFPMMGFITANWAPIAEIAFFTTLLSSAGQLCQILTMPLSAHLCVTTGWEWAYYTHASLSTLLALLFFTCFRNSPQKHPCVAATELKIIQGDEVRRRRRDQRVPHCKIFSTKAIWAIWIAFLGNSFGFQLIVQFMPTYMNKVLKMPIERTGLSAIFPPITQLIVKMIVSYLCDRITCITERRKLQMFNTIAMCGCGLFLLPIGSGGEMAGTIALCCFTLSLSSLGLVTCGSLKSATLVARQYAHFVMAVLQMVICVGILSIPFLVSSLTPHNGVDEWKLVYFIVFLILSFTNFIFCALCDSEAALWTKEPKPLPSKSLLADDGQATVTTTA